MGKIIQLFNDETQQKEYPVTVMDAIIDKDGRKLQASIDAKYSKPATGIPESDLAQAVKDKLNRSSSAATWGSITGTLASQTDLNTELGKKYAKPSGGIPENDLAQAVKTKLNAGGTFTVSIRETPYADILAAINAGKIPVTDELADRYVFGGLSGSVIYFFQADPDSLFFVTVDEDDEWLDGELPLTGLYVKPGTGIPESDLAQAVKNKLAGGAGAVRHDVDQSLQLSDQAKSTARQNIEAEKAEKLTLIKEVTLEEAVSYVDVVFTTEQTKIRIEINSPSCSANSPSPYFRLQKPGEVKYPFYFYVFNSTFNLEGYIEIKNGIIKSDITSCAYGNNSNAKKIYGNIVEAGDLSSFTTLMLINNTTSVTFPIGMNIKVYSVE